MPPSYDALRVFGYLCFAHNQKAKGDKFASRSRRCVFVAYPRDKKGWKLFDIDSGDYFVSRDVVFYENEFPYIIESDVKGNVQQVVIPLMEGHGDGVVEDVVNELTEDVEADAVGLEREEMPSDGDGQSSGSNEGGVERK